MKTSDWYLETFYRGMAASVALILLIAYATCWLQILCVLLALVLIFFLGLGVRGSHTLFNRLRGWFR